MLCFNSIGSKVSCISELLNELKFYLLECVRKATEIFTDKIGFDTAIFFIGIFEDGDVVAVNFCGFRF